MFITLEGIEGSGKTTQRKLLVERLRNTFGYDAIVETREPGGTDVGERCRNILLRGYRDITPLAEAFVVAASRSALVETVIRPALKAGKIVVCDRYVDTTYTIQGYGMGVPLEHLRTICGISTGGLMPDMTIYLDINVRQGHRRKHKQQKEQRAAGATEEYNHMDDRGIELGARYRDGYRELISIDPARWLVVSAQVNSIASPESIHRLIYDAVSNHPTLVKRMFSIVEEKR